MAVKGEGPFFERTLDAERDAFLNILDDRGIMDCISDSGYRLVAACLVKKNV
jgi:hypothetical protein